ncbi:MAG: hypothetical protein ABUT20_37620, partial [Bacteroidota bacterium]
MPNRSIDALFLLIKTLEKSEKRNFKLYVKRNSGGGKLKTTQLFDALDKMNEYDEKLLLKKNKSLKKEQLSNIKASLYKQILGSLRSIRDENNIDIQLHEQMDHARILYNKGLYLQTLKILEKIKEMAKASHQLSHLQQVLFFEKKIEALYITRSMQERADQLSLESDTVSSQLLLTSKLSNLSLQLYSWYIKHGHARNKKDEDDLINLMTDHMPEEAKQAKGFYERLYLYQSYCWHAFIRQDFLQYYRYTQKWVDLFTESPGMIEVETGNYIKGMHNLMGAHFDLMNHKKLAETVDEFEKFTHRKMVQRNENNRILTFVYLYTSKINLHFIEGRFTDGVKLVPYIEEKLKEYELYLDRHRVLVFYYKIA